MRAALLAAVLLGCRSDETCPTAVLEIRAFEGDPVTATAVTCTPAPGYGLCSGSVTATRAGASCGGERVRITGGIGGHTLVLYLEQGHHGPVRHVRVLEERPCQDECDVVVVQARGGWIMPATETGLESGRFSVQLEGYVIAGDYLTTAP
jgi:hypothetical protein